MKTLLPELSLVIPTFRRPRQLKILLKSLTTQEDFCKKIEVLIVSNLPDVKSRKVFNLFSKCFGWCNYHETGEIGVNRARNLGLQRAQGAVVLFLDDDCEIVSSDYLSLLLTHHRLHPGAAAIGGDYLIGRHQGLCDIAYHLVQKRYLRIHQEKGVCRALLGGNVSYKKPLLEDLRFDEHIQFGGAELGLHNRLLEREHTLLYFSNISVKHNVRSGLRTFLWKALKQGQNVEGTKQNAPVVDFASNAELVNGWSSNSAVKTFFLLWLLEMFDEFYALGRDRGFSAGSRRVLLKSFFWRAAFSVSVRLLRSHWQEAYRIARHISLFLPPR